MMGSPTDESNNSHQDLSDLVQIRGIGAVKKRWLNALGIATIADLAQASADAIEAQSKRDGRTLSHDELTDWISQAQAYCAEVALEPLASSPEAPEIALTSASQLLAKAQTAAENDPVPWLSCASFRVDYQTRQLNGNTEKRFVAHHLDTGETECWDAGDTRQMQQWLSDRVAAALPCQPTSETTVSAHPIVAEITQLRMLQPDHMSLPLVADQTTPIFPEAIQTVDPFALEVSMHFAGLSEASPEKTVAYQVQCLARNLATGVTDSLGEVTAHVCYSQDSIYKVLLPSLRLLQAGSYRLKVLVTLQNAPAALGLFKVPLLQVI